MNILISTTSNLVIQGQNQPIYQDVDQWASGGYKLGIPVNDALVVNDVTAPDVWCLDTYTYVDGVWTVVNQEIYDAQVEANNQAEAEVKRKGRDERLVASDWTQAGDLPIQFRTPWATYRQELRDMPTAPNWPWNPYPEVPRVPPPGSMVTSGVTEA
jgi:hypothetical protein